MFIKKHPNFLDRRYIEQPSRPTATPAVTVRTASYKSSDNYSSSRSSVKQSSSSSTYKVTKEKVLRHTR